MKQNLVKSIKLRYQPEKKGMRNSIKSQQILKTAVHNATLAMP